MSKTPEIRINYGSLLAASESKVLAEKYNLKLDSEAQYEEWTKYYRKEWARYEPKIIPSLQNALGVSFYRDVIDVTCAPFFIPKSDPLTMDFRSRPREFVDILTHELCHVLLTDNDKIQIHAQKPPVDLVQVWKRLFGKHDFSLLVHIPVQALMKHVYLDVMQDPERLARDLASSDTFGSAYSGSWDYVNKRGYSNIIEQLKKSYAEIRT